ncbi:NAD-dependent epimerase/dehydratase [Stenotrophomonas maltophilia]|uniref:NAD-dependent epimerase/dehydratase n=1 Tax=Stenotrophomonas maltophilia TaxID=40324 RepID=A0A246HKB5_STEMA|nr:NAD(P)-dependent oxidoreductase [Stenotrophomonas maltophilia]OWQ52036.1 NAD-dependent epimerase/dehydratase [Stenotrophomonas maltophilia]
MSCTVIFGGSGFIGCFFADFLLCHSISDKIYLFDLESLSEKPFPYRKKLLDKHGDRICFIRGDVRSCIVWAPPEQVTLVANFAAIHREPGHEDWEYFQTNLLGAENVTNWTKEMGCQRLIFTSSISPYGVGESSKDEGTLPVPVTAYGSSKLAAEKIHLAWQAGDKDGRKLTIARPGVVFGPGEGGNVTRLVKAVEAGYFAFMGNRKTRKAGIYVKELCHAFWWTHRHQTEQNLGVVMFNGSMNPGPSIEEYVSAIQSVSGRKRFTASIPYPLILTAAYVIDTLARPLRLRHPFSPVRIRKLVRSNNVQPSFLVQANYPYKYSLRSALKDWRDDCPAEWSQAGR